MSPWQPVRPKRIHLGHAVRLLAVVSVALLASGHASATALFFNAAAASDNEATRAEWLAVIGGSTEFLVDFESGFTEGENVHAVRGLFPGDLVIVDSAGAEAIVSGGPFGGSSPIGSFALRHDERAFLEFDFTARPVDYVGFFDIDQSGTSGILTFLDGTTETFGFETTRTSGDSAEFFGIFRNDMPSITRVQLDATGDGTWAVDDLEYGVIPEPSTAILMGLGLMGLSLRAARSR